MLPEVFTDGISEAEVLIPHYQTSKPKILKVEK